ncbi:hypothetical protein [Asaia astilbis]|nr:hypothetical protein [Asaia astilbis]
MTEATHQNTAQAGDDEIADRLTREKKAQDRIRACIETQERRAQGRDRHE